MSNLFIDLYNCTRILYVSMDEIMLMLQLATLPVDVAMFMY